MEWHLDKTQSVESIHLPSVLNGGHFQTTDQLKAYLPLALTQLFPNLEKEIELRLRLSELTAPKQ